MRIINNRLQDTLKLYFILGSANCVGDPREVLRDAIEGGITIFQYREKGDGALTGKDKLELAKDLQTICHAHHIPFIINDDIDLAIAIDADGVHIGQEDEKASSVRERIGGNKILGVSAHTVEEALAATEHGADYLGIGPIYPTLTKKDAKRVQGTALIRTLRKEGIKIPIVGIGGIKIENARDVIMAGADGVSVITAISHASSVKEASLSLRRTVMCNR